MPEIGTSPEGVVLPLSGLRVLDLTSKVAGPFCTKPLADAGASVVKVERPGGDPQRVSSASGRLIDPDVGAPLFQYLHGGKTSLVLDWTTEIGRLELLELVGRCDVIV